MKIALYIEDGVEQLVLTPQTKTEEALLYRMEDGTRRMSIYRGSFYACRGGWMRKGEERDSVMIRLDAAEALDEHVEETS